MPSIGLDKANFLALVLETLLYGAFTVLFGAATWVILNKHGRVNTLLLSTLCAIWVLATVHWIIDVIRGVQAFVELEDGSADAYYFNLSHPLQATKTAVYVTLTLVADSFVIFRLYTVWSKNCWVIIFPIMLLLGTGVGGYGATWAFSQAAPGTAIFLPAIVPWVTSFISLTFCTNVICTSLIAFRILSVQNAVKMLNSGKRTRGALAIMAESAALYSASVLSLLITYLLGSNAQYTVLDFTAPLIGITFSVIVLRVSLGLTGNDDVSNMATTATGESHSLGTINRNRAVAVNVSQLVTVDDGYRESDRDYENGAKSFGNYGKAI